MALDLFAGAALGAVAGELLKAILDVKDKTADFKSGFNRLQSTLQSVMPLVDEIERLNKVLDRPKSEIQKLVATLNEGKEIVHKSSKIPRWDYHKKYRYSKKILKLDESLMRFFNIDLQLIQARDVKELLSKVKLESLSQRSEGFGSCSPAPELPGLIIGLDVSLKELKMKLLEDGDRLLVLCGHGGIGKTTLALKFCRDEEVKEKFENIFFVNVSTAPILKVTVQKVLEKMGHRASEFQNNEDAINSLRHLLRRRDNHKAVLLVLDDIKEDSGSVLLDNLMETPIPGCQILVTSRYAFPKFGSACNVKLLNDQDSRTLFHHLAFPRDKGDALDLDEDLVEKIVSSCKGLPLALVVTAHSLRQRPEVVWRKTAKKLSEGRSIFDVTANLLDRLAISLEYLDDSVKECFLDLGLFPEDQRIPSSALIDMWTELYDLDEDDVYVNLLELHARNLADLVVSTGKDVTEVDGCYNELFVGQHDLLRKLAIHLNNQQNTGSRKRIFMNIRGNEFPKYSKDEEKTLLNARVFSVSTDNMFSSDWCDIELPEVEVLILNLHSRKHKLPHFMEKMSKLKILFITNHGFGSAELNDFPKLDYFSNLRKLRLEKVSIPILNDFTVQMEHLQKISLVMCEIDWGFNIQISHAMPNLKDIEIDYCSNLRELPVELCNITHLKKLSITNCHNLAVLPQEIGKMTNLQVLRLNACTGLLELPESIGSLHELNYLDISDCLSLETLPKRIGELCRLRKLDMRGCSRLCELPWSFKDLVQLKHVICDEEAANLWEAFQIPRSSLKVKVHQESINLNWLQI